jgi:hypothetical protein
LNRDGRLEIAKISSRSVCLQEASLGRSSRRQCRRRRRCFSGLIAALRTDVELRSTLPTAGPRHVKLTGHSKVARH